MDGNWGTPSGKLLYSPTPNDPPAPELAIARDHFFLPYCFRDSLGYEAIMAYDSDDHIPSKNHNLLVVET
jgi:hypothetical protein